MSEGESLVKFIFAKTVRQYHHRQCRHRPRDSIAAQSVGRRAIPEPHVKRRAAESHRHRQEAGRRICHARSTTHRTIRDRSPASSILKDSGLTDKELKAAIEELRKGKKATDQSAEETYNSLNKYAINLNERARQGKLDPVIGRDDEIRRVLQILSRRTKNNPMLIGEPGTCGKTAIAEGLAQRIVRGDVPENLRSKQIFSLDMGASWPEPNTKASSRND